MSLSEKDENCQSCEFQQNLDLLRQTPFFSGLTLEALKVIAYLCSREFYKPGDYLYNQAEDDGQAIYILTGQAELSHTAEGRTQIIRSCGEGELIGGLSLLGPMHRVFSLKATTDITCLVLKRPKFNKAVAQFPEMLPRILKAVVDQIGVWDNRTVTRLADNPELCQQTVGISLL